MANLIQDKDVRFALEEAACRPGRSHQLVCAWSAHENESTGGMPELMDRHPQSCCLKDALGDLVAEKAAWNGK